MASVFQYVITVEPLGLLYGSAGAFLSPANLVGRAGRRFPPDAPTLSGLYYNGASEALRRELGEKLHLAGPFWAEQEDPLNFYVPIPWTRVVGEDSSDEWTIADHHWQRTDPDLKPAYRWQPINSWKAPLRNLQKNQARKDPWQFVPALHPHLKDDERCVPEQDGLFLENAAQMCPGTCLVYLASHPLSAGWYRFGGESHVVQIGCRDLPERSKAMALLAEPIDRAFALLTPGIWGSNRFSLRHPQHPDFPKPVLMLTEKPVPFRYRIAE